jgi:hypothetical protein
MKGGGIMNQMKGVIIVVLLTIAFLIIASIFKNILKVFTGNKK